MYPKHRLAYKNEISGEIEFKCKNIHKYFPKCDHVWVVDMRKIKTINSNELCEYLLRETIYIFGNKKINFTI
jgi:hypothetical protein